jgi:hypothetical protein
MAIVTIANETATPDTEVGRLLAGRLHYRYVDQGGIAKTAERLRRVTAGLIPDPPAPTPVETEAHEYLASIRAALYELAKDDGVVFVDQGSVWALGGLPHALRVRIISGRTSTRAGLDETPYDVTIDRDGLSPRAAVDLLSAILRQGQRTTTEADLQRVRDEALAARVHLALTMYRATRNYRIGVEVERGVVRLDSAEILDAAVEVAREVPGVSRIIMRRTPTRLAS